MLKLHVLGSGCPKCTRLAENVRAAADELGLQYELEKVTDINEIMRYNVMTTPALAVNGEVRVTGKVPGVEEIKTLLK